jgi:hypothetical protein
MMVARWREVVGPLAFASPELQREKNKLFFSFPPRFPRPFSLDHHPVLPQMSAHLHHHIGEHGHDYANANRDHFDSTAHQYEDRKGGLELGRIMAEGMMSMYDFDEDETTALDFACGTG